MVYQKYRIGGYSMIKKDVKWRLVGKRALSAVLSTALVVSLGTGISLVPEKTVKKAAAAASSSTYMSVTKFSSASQVSSGLSSGYYVVDANTTFSGSNGQDGLAIKASSTVVIEVKSGVTLTCIGKDASGITGGGAGIRVPSSSRLYLVGQGKIVATGGRAANGKSGSNGSAGGGTDGDDYMYGGSGGSGGAGGGGAGAGIGSSGGTGGSGGSGGSGAAKTYYDGNKGSKATWGGSGGYGGNGSGASAAGSVYVLGKLTVTATGGSSGYAGGSGANSYGTFTGTHKKNKL